MGGTFPAATQFTSVARRLRRDWTVEVVAGETEGAWVFMRRWAANSSKVRSKNVFGADHHVFFWSRLFKRACFMLALNVSKAAFLD